jgi:hypothetical protein
MANHPEQESLKVVEDFVDELKHALDSLGDKMPTPQHASQSIPVPVV